MTGKKTNINWKGKSMTRNVEFLIGAIVIAATWIACILIAAYGGMPWLI